MKKLFILLLLITLFTAGVYAEVKKEPCGAVIYRSGPADEPVYPGDALKAAKGQKIIILFKNGVEVRLDGSTLAGITSYGVQKGKAALFIRLQRGRLWIKSMQEGRNNTTEITAPFCRAAINRGVVDFDLIGKKVETFTGVVVVTAGKIKTSLTGGNAATAPQFKAAPIVQPEPDEWISWNQERDRVNIIFELDIDLKYEAMAKQIIRNALGTNYAVGKIDFNSNDKKYEEYDLVTALTIKPQASKLSATGRTYEATGEAVRDIINESSPLSSPDEAAMTNAMRNLMVTVASKLNNTVSYYAYTAGPASRNILVDVSAGQQDIDEISIILKQVPGLIDIKQRAFYGQKAVFDLKFRGNGADIAGFLAGKIVNKKAINVWKYSKSVVKLNIK